MKDKILKLLMSKNFENIILGYNLMIANDLVFEMLGKDEINCGCHDFRYSTITHRNEIIQFYYKGLDYCMGNSGILWISSEGSAEYTAKYGKFHTYYRIKNDKEL